MAIAPSKEGLIDWEVELKSLYTPVKMIGVFCWTKMGLDKRERAIKKALKEQKVREQRRKTKEWVRSFKYWSDPYASDDGERLRRVRYEDTDV